MADFHDKNKLEIDAWIYANINRLTKDLIKKKKGESCIYLLIIESSVAVNQGRLSLGHWIIVVFSELARFSEKWKDYSSYRKLCIGIEILLDVFSSKPASVHTLREIEKTLDVLENIAEKKEFRNYKGFFWERGWEGERTAGEILSITNPS